MIKQAIFFLFAALVVKILFFCGNEENEQPQTAPQKILNLSNIPSIKFVLAHKVKSTFWAYSIRRILLKLGLEQASESRR